jgi:hypothetical protein
MSHYVIFNPDGEYALIPISSKDDENLWEAVRLWEAGCVNIDHWFAKNCINMTWILFADLQDEIKALDLIPAQARDKKKIGIAKKWVHAVCRKVFEDGVTANSFASLPSARYEPHSAWREYGRLQIELRDEIFAYFGDQRLASKI